MAKPEDTQNRAAVSPLALSSALERLIETQRARLLQAHAVLTCLYDVLLHSDGEHAVQYAQATHLAAKLLDESAERLGVQRLRPLIEAMRAGRDYTVASQGDPGSAKDDEKVRDSASAHYLN